MGKTALMVEKIAEAIVKGDPVRCVVRSKRDGEHVARLVTDRVKSLSTKVTVETTRVDHSDSGIWYVDMAPRPVVQSRR